MVFFFKVGIGYINMLVHALSLKKREIISLYETIVHVNEARWANTSTVRIQEYTVSRIRRFRSVALHIF